MPRTGSESPRIVVTVADPERSSNADLARRKNALYAAAIERHGLKVVEETGVIYNLIADRWEISSDMDVNYMVLAEKA